MKRRILLVDDDVAVLLTMKAVLEISGFDIDTAASAREGKHKLRQHEYHMIITDMRMESEAAGAEVIAAARTAPYHPAVALLTAFPIEEDDWQGMGADKMLVKPMHTRLLLEQIEKLMATHEQKLKIWSAPAPKAAAPARSATKKTPKRVVDSPVKASAKKTTSKKVAASKVIAKKAPAKKAARKARS
jgi:DNA-binding response OmpR family regulator